MDKKFLNEHYEKILRNNRDCFLNGGNGDILLKNAENDNRMALVVLIRIAPDISAKISECIQSLREIEPGLYFYPEKDFHITVMDILRGEEGRRIPDNLDDYIRCIKKCSMEISPFNIMFDGLTASDNAIMVKGYYDEQLQQFREALRASLASNGLLLEERYKTVSSHITISRLHEKYKNADKLMHYIEEPHILGTMTVNSFEISFHNWYDTRKQVLEIVKPGS
ncbi:2'-5' RNA ligase family protein [Butyrivibrio sp. AC2005]|uniref:2'-5' RNA ligase family protein n=1 Tax=Butyrivibrio sp. AC2005 TaxID=1280672 RepID=UPI00041FFC07|nr:2'-5' RNA ligase family protein [Butyrivibrio sp. AC2005]